MKAAPWPGRLPASIRPRWASAIHRHRPSPSPVEGDPSPGVRRLLGDDAAPIPVPDDVVLYLQERQSRAGFITPGQPLRPWTAVRFRRGPFALLEGIIERPASQADRVRVLLTLVRTPLAVEAPIDDLEQT